MMTQTQDATQADTLEELAARVAELEKTAGRLERDRRQAISNGDAPRLVLIDAERQIAATRLSAARDQLATARATAAYVAWSETATELRTALDEARADKVAKVAAADEAFQAWQEAKRAIGRAQYQIEVAESQLGVHQDRRPPNPARQGLG